MKKGSANTQEKPFNGATTYGKLGIIPLKSTQEIGAKIDAFLVDWRKERVESESVDNTNDYSLDTFIVEASTPRFGSGEGKGAIKQSVRGKDLYVLAVQILCQCFLCCDFFQHCLPLHGFTSFTSSSVSA